MAASPNFIEYVCGKAVAPTEDAQLEGILLDARARLRQGRPNYLWLKDLVNPQQAYWAHIGSTAIPSEALRSAFAFGDRMHDLAGRLLQRVPGFAGQEALLDGRAVGIPGVRGKIDFRLNESIVEFKTTSHTVDSGSQVWDSVPQDIEQLLFYAALWAYRPGQHLLVFHTSNAGRPLRIFRVQISDHGAITTQLRARANSLNSAVEGRDPSRLKRCRYFAGECPPRQSGECTCVQLEDWDTSVLRRSCTLSRDEQLESQLEPIWATVRSEPRPLSSWDLAVPRRAYGRRTGAQDEEDWIPDDEGWVWRALREADLLPGPLEGRPRTSLDRPIPFRASGFFLRRPGSSARVETDPEPERKQPALLRRWKRTTHPAPFNLKNQIMQLGVLCALSGSPTGVLIEECPAAPAAVVAYQVTFSGIADISTAVRQRLAQISLAIESGNVQSLPECPAWLDRSTCPGCLCREQAQAG